MAHLFGSVLKATYNALPEINKATLSGAIDIIVAEQPDGTLRSSPFHVRFGKMQVLRPRDRIVAISVNGEQTELFMKLGTAGEAYFCEETDEPPEAFLATSPLLAPSPTPEHEPEPPFTLIPDKAATVAGDSVPGDKTPNPAESPVFTPYGSPSSATSDPESRENRWSYIWTWGRLPKRRLQRPEEPDPEQDHMLLTDYIETRDDDDGQSEDQNSADGNVSDGTSEPTEEPAHQRAIDVPTGHPSTLGTTPPNSSILTGTTPTNTPAGGQHAPDGQSGSWFGSVFRRMRGGPTASPLQTPEHDGDMDGSSTVDDPSQSVDGHDNEDAEGDPPGFRPSPDNHDKSNEDPDGDTAGFRTPFPEGEGFGSTHVSDASPSLDALDGTGLLALSDHYHTPRSHGLGESPGSIITPSTDAEELPPLGRRWPGRTSVEHRPSPVQEGVACEPEPRPRTVYEAAAAAAAYGDVLGADQGEVDHDDVLAVDQERPTPTEMGTLSRPIPLRKFSNTESPVLSYPTPSRSLSPSSSPLSSSYPPVLALSAARDSPVRGDVAMPDESFEGLDAKGLAPSAAAESKARACSPSLSAQPPGGAAAESSQASSLANPSTIATTVPSASTAPSSPVRRRASADTPTSSPAKSEPGAGRRREQASGDRGVNGLALFQVGAKPCDRAGECDSKGTLTPRSPNLFPLQPIRHQTDDNGELWQLLTQASPESPVVQLALCRPSKGKELSAQEAETLFDNSLLDFDMFKDNPLVILSDPALYIRLQGRVYPAKIAMPLLVSLLAFGRMPDVATFTGKHDQASATKGRGWMGWLWGGAQDKGPHPDKDKDKEKDRERDKDKDKALDESDADMLSDIEGGGAAGSVCSNDDVGGASPMPDQEEPKKYIRMTLNPTPAQLARLNLKQGANAIVFSLAGQTKHQQEVEAVIYLWPADSKIVITDIDGTITKSDVLGHLLPLMGRDWSQQGVAGLLSQIKANGYQLLYLTARPIGQVSRTKNYLHGLQQDGIQLPQGPVLTSPDRLVAAFQREVIRRKPQEFKIACLQNIVNLFPGSKNPFHAGFGNRPTDQESYAAVGVPISRTFTINHHGEISNALNVTYKSTYSSLHHLADMMFPALHKADEKTVKDYDTDYNDFSYWRPLV
mmetsp:Transcript_29934/g.69219  ORF Transcript_29934/g.69219 Transcript_29934/m.69219 type:complete len:1139 (+) Transcript_29934:115-3531(+)